MPQRYFPIKTQTACQLKWTWSSLYLYEGTTNSCHRVAKTQLNLDTFDTFHNTPKKLADRQIMLEGQWPQGGCEYCQKIEQAGGTSDRMMHLAIPDLSPPELDDDPGAVSVTPRIVEVYFDNTCNLSCVYCHDGFSSRIQQENKRFGRFESQGLVIDNTHQRHSNFEQITESFWTWMATNYASIRRFHLLGGEPFYQQQFDTCLDFLYNNTNKDLEFNIVSNLMVEPDRLRGYIDRIKDLVSARRIKRFEITASIDCWGPEQEYVRHGLDLQRWKQNFEYLVKQSWITLNINQVISVLTIPTMPDLITYVNTQRINREIGHHLITVNQPTHLNPDILGQNFFDNYFEQVLNVMPADTWQQQQARDYMQGVRLQISVADKNPTEINKLRTYLDELDRRRNTNWQQTFPWLTGALDVL
jgi:pyruvate-formate lyase-activating enzyme